MAPRRNGGHRKSGNSRGNNRRGNNRTHQHRSSFGSTAKKTLSRTFNVSRKFILAANVKDSTGTIWYGAGLQWAGWLLGALKYLAPLVTSETHLAACKELGYDKPSDLGSGVIDGHVTAMLLGAEDICIEDPRINLGPLSRKIDWKQNACHTSYRAASVRKFKVRITPIAELQSRGGTISVGFQTLREDEARADARSHNSWMRQVRQPGTAEHLEGMTEHPTTGPFTVTHTVPPGTWASESHRMGVTGEEYVRYKQQGTEEALDLTKYYVNSDSIPGGPPIVRLVIVYQDQSAEHANDVKALYDAGRSLYRIDIGGTVRCEEPITDLSGTWKVNTDDEELEVSDFQVIRHRPITLSNMYDTKPKRPITVSTATSTFQVTDYQTTEKGIVVYTLPAGLRPKPNDNDFIMVDDMHISDA